MKILSFITNKQGKQLTLFIVELIVNLVKKSRLINIIESINLKLQNMLLPCDLDLDVKK